LRMRLLSLASGAALVALAACSGSAPPPPVARATAAPASDDLRPLSSRDAGGPVVTPSADTAPSANPSLPPGHPPIGGGGPHGAPDPHGNVAAAGPVISAGSIKGSISIAPKLRPGPAGVLYVIAKREGATIAVRRVDKPSFPYAFEISDADSMTPGIRFEGPLDVIARLSRSGDAIPAKGDIEGAARGVKVPARGVSITIDTVRQ
jgi:hypothetical protein